MRSSAALTVISRSSRFAHLRAAFERTNKSASIAVAILVCLFWAQYLRPQSLGGRAAYVLVSGKSMLPRYHTGDLVLVEKQPSYHVGQLIAYRVPKGDPMAGAQVIHRIIGGTAQYGFIVSWRLFDCPPCRPCLSPRALRLSRGERIPPAPPNHALHSELRRSMARVRFVAKDTCRGRVPPIRKLGSIRMA